MPVAEINEAFPKILRQLRKLRGLSQEDLALKAGLHRNYISALERQLKSPTLITMNKISAVLETPLSTILTMTEKEAAKAKK